MTRSMTINESYILTIIVSQNHKNRQKKSIPAAASGYFFPDFAKRIKSAKASLVL